MNRHYFRATACALGLFLVAGCGDSSGAEDGTPAFTAAADALAAKLNAGSVPAATDPAVTAFETQAGGALKTLGTPALPVKGFDSYEALCGKTATIVGAYVNSGVDSASDKAAAMNANAVRYLDQMFTPLLFSAHCTAAHMPFIEKEMTTEQLSAKRGAVEQVRGGAYGQATGLLQMAAAEDLDAARKGRIMDLLAADAGNFAIPFNREQRESLAAVVDTLPEELRAKGAAIKTALSSAPCGKLCSM